MTLFKYIGPDRIDIIENCEIRFTQPGALNDPFELRPQFESLLAEADGLGRLNEAPVDLEPMLKQAYALLPQEQRLRLPFDTAARFVEATFATNETRTAMGTRMRALLQSMRDGAAPVRERIYQALNDNIGILSLSEASDHELMWAHYAHKHTGLVLGFDNLHPFFNRRRSEHDKFYFLRKVMYADPGSIWPMGDDSVLVTKGKEWAYEREWRMILPLKDATRSFTFAGDTVHLFSFPSDALTGIVLGAYAASALEAAVRRLVETRQELAHVHVSRAILDLAARTVRVPWQTPGGA